MAEDFRCNMAVLGKTGVGKSSLLNYLCGTTFKAGAGKPQTGMDLYPCDGTLNGQTVRVFDSWGIEPDKVEQWKDLLRRKMEEHGAEKPPAEWFHAVVYCVQLSSDRAEAIDAEIIAEFMDEGYRVVVALTKCIQGSNIAKQEEMTSTLKAVVKFRLAEMSKEKALKLGNADAAMTIDDAEAIVAARLVVVPVCSVEKKLINGTVTHPFGKEELARAILDGWRETVINRLPLAAIGRLKARVNTFVNESIKLLRERFDKGEISGNIDAVKTSEMMETFYAALEQFMQKLFKEEYSGIVLGLLKDARSVGESLVQAMGLEYYRGSIEVQGLKWFKDEVKSQVTAKTWMARIFSFGIAAAVGKFSDRAQRNVKDAIETQYRKGGIAACNKIDERAGQIKADVESLLETGGKK